MSNKNLKVIHIILLAILGIFLIGFMIYWGGGIERGTYSMKRDWEFGEEKGDFTTRKEEVVPMEGVKEVQLDLVREDIRITLVDEDQFTIIESTSKEVDESKLVSVEKKGSKLVIRAPRLQNNFGVDTTRYLVEFKMPKSYLEALQLTTVSGDMYIGEALSLKKMIVETTSGEVAFQSTLTAESFTASSVSGDFKLKDIIAQKGSISTTSGEIKAGCLEGLTAFRSVSGDIELERLVAEGFEIGTTSGSIEISEVTGGGSLSAVSGDIEVTFLSLDENLTVSTTSGTVDCMFAKSINADVDMNSTSGDLDSNQAIEYTNKRKTQGNLQLGSGAGQEIELRTVSGDIKVAQKS